MDGVSGLLKMGFDSKASEMIKAATEVSRLIRSQQIYLLKECLEGRGLVNDEGMTFAFGCDNVNPSACVYFNGRLHASIAAETLPQICPHHCVGQEYPIPMYWIRKYDSDAAQVSRQMAGRGQGGRSYDNKGTKDRSTKDRQTSAGYGR